MQSVAELNQIFVCHLLHLVRRVTRFEVRAQSPTLDGLRQNYSWLAILLSSGFISSEEFAVIVATALKTPDLLIAPASDKRCGARIATKEVFANIGAAFGFECLVITIGGAVHQINKCAFAIVSKEFIPFATPYDLDDVPARAPEN